MENPVPERPILILPITGQPIGRSIRHGFGGKIGRPSRVRQVERLGPRFTVLQDTFDARRALLRVEATGAIPEEVLVLETLGPVEDFLVAVQNIDGMEWLGEILEEDIPPDSDFFALDSQGNRKPEKTLRGRVFLVFSNSQALNQMRSLWQRWQREERLPHGLGKWNQIFDHLSDIRPWGVKDRLLETGVLADWKERVEHDEEILPCEIELWFRRDPDARLTARNRVIDLVNAQEGHILQETVIEQISYHALLVELQVAAISELIEDIEHDIALVQCEQIQSFRATGQMAGIIPEGERTSDNVDITEPVVTTGGPVVALLDGFPLQNHRRLSQRLVIDDPDDIESQYQAHERRHGTAMASLILYGELDGSENVLSRPLYVRPILKPDNRDWRPNPEETIPENTLIVDLIHRAVRRIYDGEGDTPATAPSVCVINLSIGIRDRLFDGALSPLARLLDWLAWEYRVLFIVSAGNHPKPIELGVAWSDFAAMSNEERQELIIRKIAVDARYRRLLSPAEAINVLTVGALHADQSTDDQVPRSINPYTDERLPSPINAQGMGYRRAIKPEVLAPGGRVVLLENPNMNSSENAKIYAGTLALGQKVAAPGTAAGEVNAAWYSRGTSNATALTSRTAAILYDVLDELRSEPGGELIETIPIAVWLKALIPHATEWGRGGDVIADILRSSENSRQFKEYITRILGYGGIDASRVWECAEYRVTALSGGNLRNNQAHVHRFPLPPSLSGQHVWRRLTITLAWLTPVNPAHQGWRRAALWYESSNDLLKVNRQQAQWQAVKRGTIQHEVFEGRRASGFVDGDSLEIRVNCTADAGVLEDTIPYALIMTLEVKEDIGIPLYEEIQMRVHAARVRVTPAE